MDCCQFARHREYRALARSIGQLGCGSADQGYEGRRIDGAAASGPPQGLTATKVGTFTQALYDEAKKQGWTIISMKDDWKKIFAFE